jgi:F-type H+-transporting ATPase subunit gamma
MAGAKEIRSQIASIKNTQKITRAMQMVAASKMRKSQDRMSASRPYTNKIRQVIAHLAHANPEYRSSFLAHDRPVKRVSYLVISSDRGLCGGLNHNLFRLLLKHLKQYHDQKIEAEFCTIGTKAFAFFRRFGGRVRAQATHLGDAPRIADLIGPVKSVLNAYEAGEVDRVFVAFNQFVNTMTRNPMIVQLVPIESPADPRLAKYWDYLYEPDSKQVLDELISRYIEALVYQAVVENGASEQSARMVAMKSATDNAGNLIDELQLLYNKARQSAITQELSEIVSGAAAV